MSERFVMPVVGERYRWTDPKLVMLSPFTVTSIGGGHFCYRYDGEEKTVSMGMETWRSCMPVLVDPPKICPSGEPQLAQHNWGMWRGYDPMRAGSSEVQGFCYYAKCNNLLCTAERRAKALVAKGEVEVMVDGVVVEMN